MQANNAGTIENCVIITYIDLVDLALTQLDNLSTQINEK